MNIMHLWISVALVCLLHEAVAQSQNTNDTFYFWDCGQYICEERLKKKVSSATFQGPGELVNFYGHLPNAVKSQGLWGAVYSVRVSDRQKIVDLARNELFIGTVPVTVQLRKSGKPSQSISCVTTSIGPLPQTFPYRVYRPFPADFCIQLYFERLKKIGAPPDYIAWLKQFRPSNDNAHPPPPYIAPSCFAAPPVAPPSPLHFGPGPAITPYKIPSNQVCIFASGIFTYPIAMKAVAPSATLIGPAYLPNNDIALGGRTVPNRYNEYAGFDTFYGVAYRILKSDLTRFLRYGQPSVFQASVSIVVNGLFSATCTSADLGLVPSSFPFQVFTKSPLDPQQYVNQLEKDGVPPGYGDALEDLQNRTMCDSRGHRS